MTLLLKGDAQEHWFVPCHVLGASTIQVPQLLALLQDFLQKRFSSTKIWSPYECGSIWFTLINRTFTILGNPLHKAPRNNIFSDFTESDIMASFHAVEACNNRLFRQSNRLFFWQFRKWLWKSILLVVPIRSSGVMTCLARARVGRAQWNA